jgi:hypothetical protein
MPPVPHEFADVARQLLAKELGTGPAASTAEVAEAAVRLWEKLGKHFAMLVGEMGVRTLLDRSLVLTAVQYPWLAGSTGVSRVAPLKQPWIPPSAILHAEDAAAATQGVESLIATFLGLVGRFIGQRLVVRLLREVWPELFAEETKETR